MRVSLTDTIMLRPLLDLLQSLVGLVLVLASDKFAKVLGEDGIV